MKIIYLFLAVVLMGSCSQTSSIKVSNSGKFSIDESMLNVQCSPELESTDVYATIIPNDDVVLNLYYTTLKNQFPKSWDVSFCDNAGCHFQLADSCMLSTISNKSEMKDRQLKLMVNTYGYNGTGELVLLLKSEQYSSIDTLRFKLMYTKQ